MDFEVRHVMSIKFVQKVVHCFSLCGGLLLEAENLGFVLVGMETVGRCG